MVGLRCRQGRSSEAAWRNAEQHSPNVHPHPCALGGQSDLKYISAVSAGQTLGMQDAQMLSGLYLNELLLRLSPRFDSNPELFASYGMTLQAVSQGVDVEASLRRFELELLNQLGYQINWKKDSQRSDIHPSRVYRYASGDGFELVESSGVFWVRVAGDKFVGRWSINPR